MLQTLLFVVLFISNPASAVPVTFSYYQAVPEQTDSDPNMSACGATMAPWEQIAIHRNLRGQYPCGTIVVGYNPLVGFKMLVVNDITAAHISPNRWDVLVGNDEPALEYGLTQGWVIGLPISP